MKKLFFFRSHSSNSGNNNQLSPPSTDKQVNWEKPTERVNNDGPCLRRSLSFSSGSLYDTGKGLKNQNGSPCRSSRYYSHKQSRSRAMTPERQTSRAKCFDASMVNNAQRVDRSDCIASDLSDISSHCSSNVSNKVLDRYIDGEQQMEKRKLRNHQFENGNAVVERPPRKFQHVDHDDARKQKPKSLSQVKGRFQHVDNGFCNESPRKLAKNVVERLSKSQLLPPKTMMRSKDEFDPDSPITIEDVYNRTLNRCSTVVYTDEDDNTSDESSHHEEISEFLERESSHRTGSVMDTDLELFKKFKEAEDRAAFLSTELGRSNFLLQFRGLSVPVLVQTIRSLTEEKLNMAHEVSAVFQDRIAEKALFREELKLSRAELDAQTRKLEKEKNELQLALERELDRRSSDWSLKLEKYQAEEHRLRERVRELAEQNVCLQRDVSSFRESEIDTKTKLTDSEKQLEDLSTQLKDVREETHYLHKNLSEMQYKYRAVEDDRDCMRRNYEEKVNECKDMHQAISRLQRACNDHEKTIDGLRGLCEELGKKISQENFDFGSTKLQVEHMRLAGVEHALRKEIESFRVEVDTLRHENIDLLNRLTNNGKEENMFSTFKLDREVQNRVSCLQNKVLPLLMESSQLGRKLLEFVKKESVSLSCTGLDAQAIMECEVKLQGLERAAENLTSSTQTISNVLHEKSTNFCLVGDESNRRNVQKSEDIVRSELKAETLLTSLLREKLYSKELEIEQLQAELAAAVRANDVLKCEVQNTMDNFSCVKHEMKDFQLQIMRKDDIMNQLQMDLQECKKELAIVRGILPKVSEERDVMWEEVKKYSEKNMLLNNEVNELRKKIEALDEDILVKEGQITILKDSIGKPFDLLAWKDSC
ncbi:hypothetical protein BUALT_Bualt06G0045000 [Buddleja alternifolia]|uniref:DUF7653 domain-containing protein n=1 Tax=Buddleja alternifolia TaxID=168488 RepID=A0AAV6XL32_9LAMI|nr:hypothetical protein BUALT_Bualt06G0045000 [Buddleja alternifolia]